MKVPIAAAAVVDMVIAALRSSGFLADDYSANAIRSVSPGISETDRDALAASLNYSGVGGGSGLGSIENVNVFIDSDDSGTGSYENFFRISHGTNTLPVPVEKEMFTLNYLSYAPNAYIAQIGPRLTEINSGDDFRGALQIGGGGTTPTLYTRLTASSEAITKLYSSGQLVLRSSTSPNSQPGDIELQVGNGRFAVTNATGTEDRVGVFAPNTFTRLYIGENPASGTNQFNIEQWSTYTRMIHGDDAAERTLFISGSYPNISNDARLRVAVGGSAGTQHLDPRDLIIGGKLRADPPPGSGEPHEASFMSVSPELNERRSVLHTWHRGTSLPDDTHLVNFHSSSDINDPNSNAIKLLSCTHYDGADRQIAFEVRGDESCYCGGIFITPGPDAAEYFDVVGEDHSPGFVMKVNSSGSLVATSSYADPSVVGVVSTNPGYVMGGSRAPSETAGKELIGMTGTLPVRATTAHGSIEAGNLLVSAPNGRAAKSPDPVVPGTVIGKALQSLVQSDDVAVEGTIKMIILNC
jgi:hypothetical protein